MAYLLSLAEGGGLWLHWGLTGVRVTRMDKLDKHLTKYGFGNDYYGHVVARQ